MDEPADKARDSSGLAGRLPWDPPRLRYLGQITDLIRGQQGNKGPSPFDSDSESAHQEPQNFP